MLQHPLEPTGFSRWWFSVLAFVTSLGASVAHKRRPIQLWTHCAIRRRSILPSATDRAFLRDHMPLDFFGDGRLIFPNPFADGLEPHPMIQAVLYFLALLLGQVLVLG